VFAVNVALFACGRLVISTTEVISIYGVADMATITKIKGKNGDRYRARVRMDGVSTSETGITWGGGIQAQGLPFETFLESRMAAGTRLPPGFKTLDYFDVETGLATSVKTLDTLTPAKLTDPRQVYSSIQGNIDDLVNFEKANIGIKFVDYSKITSRELQLAIPASTNPAQWSQIMRAIEYGRSQNVQIIITVIKR
jgi:filamentous hemagglutinin